MIKSFWGCFMTLKKIIDLAKELLFEPKHAWEKIVLEGNNYDKPITYVLFLLLIPAFSMFVGYGVVGIHSLYGYFRIPVFSAFFSAFVFYILLGIAVVMSTMMIGFFASYFSIEGRYLTYFKIAAYSFTAPLLANIFYLLPVLKFLRILGFYGCVTLFVGLPVMLKIPKEKEMQFVVTVMIGAIVIYLIFLGLSDQFLGPIYSEAL